MDIYKKKIWAPIIVSQILSIIAPGPLGGLQRFSNKKGVLHWMEHAFCSGKNVLSSILERMVQQEVVTYWADQAASRRFTSCWGRSG